jgi:D-proline reductase (dithiol) PrdB
VLARVIEAAGISSVMVTAMPDLAERAGVPRIVGVEFPFGHTLGHAGDRQEQMKVIRDALRVLRDAREPNAVEHLPYEWPDAERWKQEWHPKEPAPIIALLIEQRRRARQAQ